MGDVCIHSKKNLDLALLKAFTEFINDQQQVPFPNFLTYLNYYFGLQSKPNLLKKKADNQVTEDTEELKPLRAWTTLRNDFRLANLAPYEFHIKESWYDSFCQHFISTFMRLEKKVYFKVIATTFYEWKCRLDSDNTVTHSEQVNTATSEFYNLIKDWLKIDNKDEMKEQPIIKKENKPKSYLIGDGKELFMQPLHFYHSTQSLGGPLYWFHAELDFASGLVTDSGTLITEKAIPNYFRTKNTDYIFELKKDRPEDLILLSLRAKYGTDPILYCIFDKEVGYDYCTGGLVYHDDWTRDWRVSGCLLSLSRITDQIETAPLPPKECAEAETMWDLLFNKAGKKVVFEKYKLPPNYEAI